MHLSAGRSVTSRKVVDRLLPTQSRFAQVVVLLPKRAKTFRTSCFVDDVRNTANKLSCRLARVFRIKHRFELNGSVRNHSRIFLKPFCCLCERLTKLIRVIRTQITTERLLTFDEPRNWIDP